MSGCGCGGDDVFDGASAGYRRVLWAVIAINAVMFAVELTAGLIAGSMALRADALDFLGDTATYGLSLYAIGRSARFRAGAAMVKGLSLGLLAVWVLGSTAYRVLILGVPDAGLMGGVGALAFAANMTSALLLMRWRDGDANVRSVWLCSRNDAIGNLAVVAAAGGVVATGAAWPDLAVAGVIAGLFLHSSIGIISQARGELATARE